MNQIEVGLPAREPAKMATEANYIFWDVDRGRKSSVISQDSQKNFILLDSIGSKGLRGPYMFFALRRTLYN